MTNTLSPSVPFGNPLFRLSFLALKPGVEMQRRKRHKRCKEKPFAPLATFLLNFEANLAQARDR